MDWLYTISGFAVGFIVGLTGVGGGSLMTPLLMHMATQHPQLHLEISRGRTELLERSLRERAIDALAPVSVVTLEDIQGRQASTVADLLYTVPGVWIQDRGDEPSTSINIRGLQDFGRVAVVVDGARQIARQCGRCPPF